MPTNLAKWKEEIRKAKLYQEQRGRLERWKQYRSWYRNEYPESVVSVSKVFGIGRALIPQLYFKAPSILCRSRKPQMGPQNKILESINQWLIEHIGLKLQLKYIILDAYLTNIGVGKCGYSTISTELPTPDDEQNQAIAEAMGLTPEEMEEEVVSRGWSYHDFIKPDSPWMLRIRPQDLLVPWGFADEFEVPWAAFRVIRPVKDVKKDPVYKNKSKLQPNVRIDLDSRGVMSPNMFGQIGQTAEFVELIEIWDKRDGSLRVLSMDHDSWLREEEDHGLPIVGIPAVVLRFNPDGDDFWGVSDVEHIRKQVDELNENRTHEIETKRLSNVKAVVDTNVISEDEVVKLEKGKPGPIIRGQGAVAGAIAEFKTSVPPDFYRVDEIIGRDIQETVGFSRNQTGEFDVSRRTATEANIVRESNSLRADERRDLVGDFISTLFRDKIHPMIFLYWTQPRVIEVTGMGGWYQYTGPQIKGDYDVLVVPDSSMPLTKQQEQQIAMQAFQLFRNDPRIKQRPLYTRLMYAFKDFIPDPEELLLSDEELQQQSQGQTQTQLQQAQQAKQIDVEGEKDIIRTKAQTEMQLSVAEALMQSANGGAKGQRDKPQPKGDKGGGKS